MKRKGFTLVELLVVIAIIAMLMGILMPALARVRQIANRMVCGSNLSGLGKGMLVYANDYDGDFAVAGGARATWGSNGYIKEWDATDVTGEISLAETAYGKSPAEVTITSSWYLLVKYADVTTKQFICKGDMNTNDFSESSDFTGDEDFDDITYPWDFSKTPGAYCSYSYHMPYFGDQGYGFPISSSSDPSSPVASDRNPYCDVNARDAAELADWSVEYNDEDNMHNSATHQYEGQNVLYQDSHVAFEKQANVGIDNDNIWLYWEDDDPTEEDRQVGTEAGTPDEQPGEGYPRSKKDAYLVIEAQDAGTGGGGGPVR